MFNNILSSYEHKSNISLYISFMLNLREFLLYFKHYFELQSNNNKKGQENTIDMDIYKSTGNVLRVSFQFVYKNDFKILIFT